MKSDGKTQVLNITAAMKRELWTVATSADTMSGKQALNVIQCKL